MAEYPMHTGKKNKSNERLGTSNCPMEKLQTKIAFAELVSRCLISTRTTRLAQGIEVYGFEMKERN